MHSMHCNELLALHYYALLCIALQYTALHYFTLLYNALRCIAKEPHMPYIAYNALQGPMAHAMHCYAMNCSH